MALWESKEDRTDLSIGAVARLAGLRPSAIRYYERLGILPQPSRTAGRRTYDGAILERLDVIRAAKRAGFSLAEVKALTVKADDGLAPRERWQLLARKKLVEIDAAIARAEEMRTLLRRGLECRCATLESCELIAAAAGRP
jgi:MerR family transcriptional regulator, redox-sensitive transcriptional activator SoxR